MAQWDLFNDILEKLEEKPILIEDQLSFIDEAAILSNDIVHSRGCPYVLAIWWDWGTWKTSFMQILRSFLDEKYYEEALEQLSDEKWKIKKGEEDIYNIYWKEKVYKNAENTISKKPCKTIWFRAWEEEFHQEENKKTWESLFGQILREIHEDTQIHTSLKKDKKQYRLFESFYKAGLSFLKSYNARPDFKEATFKGVMDFLKNFFLSTEPKTSVPSIDKNASLQTFRENFKEITHSDLFPYEKVVVFIDDLDRCDPQEAFRIVKSLKAFFETDKLVFVFGVEKKMLEMGYKLEISTQSLNTSIEFSFDKISFNRFMEKIISNSLEMTNVFLQHDRMDIYKKFIKINIDGIYKKVWIKNFDSKPIVNMLIDGSSQNLRKWKRILRQLLSILERISKDKMIRNSPWKNHIILNTMVFHSILSNQWLDVDFDRLLIEDYSSLLRLSYDAIWVKNFQQYSLKYDDALNNWMQKFSSYTDNKLSEDEKRRLYRIFSNSELSPYFELIDYWLWKYFWNKNNVIRINESYVENCKNEKEWLKSIDLIERIENNFYFWDFDFKEWRFSLPKLNEINDWRQKERLMERIENFQSGLNIEIVDRMIALLGDSENLIDTIKSKDESLIDKELISRILNWYLFNGSIDFITQITEAFTLIISKFTDISHREKTIRSMCYVWLLLKDISKLRWVKSPNRTQLKESDYKEIQNEIGRFESFSKKVLKDWSFEVLLPLGINSDFHILNRSINALQGWKIIRIGWEWTDRDWTSLIFQKSIGWKKGWSGGIKNESWLENTGTNKVEYAFNVLNQADVRMFNEYIKNNLKFNYEDFLIFYNKIKKSAEFYKRLWLELNRTDLWTKSWGKSK